MRTRKHFLISVFSGLAFYLILEARFRTSDLILVTFLKFCFYLNLWALTNSAFILRSLANGSYEENYNFQKKQVYFWICVMGILFIIELPVILSQIL